MDWTWIEHNWMQLKGVAKQKWAKLTDDDLDYISGTHDRLIGRLEEKYGFSREEAERQAEEWFRSSAMPIGKV